MICNEWIRRIQQSLFVLFLAYVFVNAETMRDTVDLYFDLLQKAIVDIGNEDAIKTSKKYATDELFVSLLHKHKAIYGLTRTNSKGYILNEVVRMKDAFLVTKKVDHVVHWSLSYSKHKKEYYGYKKEDTKYYLLWAYAIFGVRNNYTGSCIATIDLMECLTVISGTINKPFAIYFQNNIIYSHEWKNDLLAVSHPLKIPGIDGLSISYEHSVPDIVEKQQVKAFQSETSSQGIIQTPATKFSPTKQNSVVHEFIQQNKIWALIIGGIVFAGIIVLLVYFYLWLNAIFNSRNDKKPEDEYGRR